MSRSPGVKERCLGGWPAENMPHALEATDAIPALDNLVLDFDHYGRVVGLRITAAPIALREPLRAS
jgi:hypothetical protein